MIQAMWPCALLLSYLACQASGQLKFTPVPGGSTPSLRPSTGMVVLPTPPPGSKDLVVVGNGTRYKGALNPDPQNRPDIHGLYEVLAQESDVVGVHMAHVPNTDKVLYMERPSDKRSRTRQIAGTFDVASRVWTPVDSSDGLFCSGHTITSEGEVVVAGGHKATGGYADGMRSVRLFNQAKNPKLLVNATWMEWKRWYPTLTLLPDSQIMIMGGTKQVGGSSGGNPEYELYQPETQPNLYPLPFQTVEATFLKQMKKMYYPFNFVLPTGDVYSFGERQGRIMVAQTGKYRLAADGTYIQGPRLEGTDFTQYPYTASAAYSALTWEDNYSSTTLMVFGGAPVAGVDDNDLLAARNVRSMKISWTKKGSGYAYKFSNWTIEDMGIARVMGYGTLLPNGDVVVTCGAQVGVAGDGRTSAGSGGRSDYPVFWAQLYQPDRPLNQRLTILAGSTIARLYHGTAVLTTNATILIAGCDRCYKLNSDVPGYVSPGSRWEYRQEIFYPPYFFDMANKPRITSVNNGQTTLDYDQPFTLQWTGEKAGTDVPVTSVSLVAPSAATHSFDMNQRVVVLKVLSVDYKTNTMTLNSPPHPYIAPPQYYMIFAMNGKTMSKGLWIKLVDSKGLGKVVPKW